MTSPVDVPPVHSDPDLTARFAAQRLAFAGNPAPPAAQRRQWLKSLREALLAPPEEAKPETARSRAEAFALTPREMEVLRLLAEGMTNKEIGGQLSIAEDTVKKHVQNLIWKLRAADRTQAAIVAYRAGLLDPIGD